MIRFTIPGEPQGKGRPRVGRVDRLLGHVLERDDRDADAGGHSDGLETTDQPVAGPRHLIVGLLDQIGRFVHGRLELGHVPRDFDDQAAERITSHQ